LNIYNLHDKIVIVKNISYLERVEYYMDRSKQFWLRFYLPIFISLLIIIIASFTNDQLDSPTNDPITGFTTFGTVSVISLFICHDFLFVYNIFKKYQNKVYNIAGYICFIVYFAAALASFIHDGIVDMIIYIYTFSAFYIVALLLDIFINLLLKAKTMKADIKAITETDKTQPKTLPKGWFIRRDVYLVQGAFIVMLIGFFFVPVIEFKILYVFILIGAFLVVLLGLSYKQQNLISKYFKEYANTLDLEVLQNKFDELKANHLHPETHSRIDLHLIDMMLNHDFAKAEELFKEINPSDPNLDKLIYKLVLIDYNACKSDYDTCINIINELLSNKVYRLTLSNLHRNLLHFKMLKDQEPDVRVLDAFPLLNQNRLSTLLSKMAHAEYYYLNRDYDKAKDLFLEIIEDNHPLETLRQEARKYLTTIS